jgi:hypothetical protein
MRRSSCSNRSDVSLSQFSTAEPVSEGGTGRLVFEPKTFLGITTPFSAP